MFLCTRDQKSSDILHYLLLPSSSPADTSPTTPTPSPHQHQAPAAGISLPQSPTYRRHTFASSISSPRRGEKADRHVTRPATIIEEIYSIYLKNEEFFAYLNPKDTFNG
ncbi:hypothetical protein E2C01_072415 [Portunus trituberculatus]|uniref:Uncharacterized protein n=1 Tax=Portunus trituberculatus TaxID=210409 RepID=A0A5B7I7N1_PORTR|nr:hypothetical protein [Portunus trituberculatus]